MTPLEIEVLLTVYCRPCEKLNKFGLDCLRAGELVQLDPSSPPKDGLFRHGYVLTRIGAAMVDALQKLPIPTRRVYWVTEFEQITDEQQL